MTNVTGIFTGSHSDMANSAFHSSKVGETIIILLDRKTALNARVIQFVVGSVGGGAFAREGLGLNELWGLLPRFLLKTPVNGLRLLI